MTSRATKGPRELAGRLHSAAIHLLRRARRTDPLSGLPAAQLSALSVLMGGPRTLGGLAAAEQVRVPTMSRLVGEMERAGVARKDADPADARVVRVRATAKGLRALAKGRALRIAAIRDLIGQLSQDERKALERAVGSLERVLRQGPPPRH